MADEASAGRRPEQQAPLVAAGARARSRGRPRVRSPESARRFQRECIRQMQATRVYLGTAYARWRSLSCLFKRTSDMAKHLLDVHQRHCTACYHNAPYHPAPSPRRTHDGVRLLNELQRASALRSQQIQKPPNDSSTPAPDDVSVVKFDPTKKKASSPCLVSVSLPEISCYIKKEAPSESSGYEEAIDLTCEGSSSIEHVNSSAT